MGSADLARQGLLRGAGRKKEAIVTVYVLYYFGMVLLQIAFMNSGMCVVLYCCLLFILYFDRVKVVRYLF